jgi:hypothetical protein
VDVKGLRRMPWSGWSDWWCPLSPVMFSWPVAVTVLVLMLVYRAVAEWQRRTTLVALVERAPGGTVIVQEKGLGGPAMWVQIGYGARPLPPLMRRQG